MMATTATTGQRSGGDSKTRQRKGRRGNQEGSITQLADGRWQARVTLEGGKRKAFYGNTRQEAAQKLTAALRDRDRGLPIVSEKQTLAAFLTGWLESVRHSIRPSTWTRYAQLVNVHLIPTLGKVTLAKLTPQQVERLYAQKLEGGLSPTTVHHLHAVLHRALGAAERQGLVPRNVSELAERPRMAHHEKQVLSPAQVRTLLAAAEGDRLGALYITAALTGMRQGELLALTWANMDLDCGVLTVRSSVRRLKGRGFVFTPPKTAKSHRKIRLPAPAVQALQRHRTRQLEERLSIGPAWEDLDLVFANEVGRPIEPQNLLRRSFYPLLENAGLPRIRFHDLRHTAATILLASGMPVNAVSELWGHSNAAITVGVYGHATADMREMVVAAMEAIATGTEGVQGR